MSRRRFIALSIAAAGVALPATALGAISGTVYADYNSNGKRDTGAFVAGSSVTATDGGIAGVVVRAFDNAGAKVGEATTGADGTYSLNASASGTVRVEFTNPSGYEPSFAGGASNTSVQFVSPDTKDVDYGIGRPGDFCQDNPKILTCRQPSADQMDAYPATGGIFTMPGAFSIAQEFDMLGNPFAAQSDALGEGVTDIAPMTAIGATFGIGVDKGGNAYFGTYVKRHSPYGPAGATNAIYKVNLATGASSTFVDLGGTLPAHSAASPGGYPPYAQDGLRNVSPGDPKYSAVYPNVGRAGLGDVDVTSDGSTLLAVEMTEAAPKLWSIPINGAGASASAGAPSSVAIPAPSALDGVSCVGPWHPMGIGIRGSQVLIGGVCGGDETQFVGSNGRTQAAAFVLERDAAGTGFSTIAAVGLGYPKGASGGSSNFLPANDQDTGLWNNWHDGPTATRGTGVPKPMVANVEVMDNGDLTLAFRDRFYDQIKSCGTVWYDSDVTNYPGNISQQDCSMAAAAEILRLCKSGSGYVREQNGTCNGVKGADLEGIMSNAPQERPDSPLYYGIAYGTVHGYTGQGGVATLPGSAVLWSTAYDISNIYQQGVRALGPCPPRTGGNGSCGPAGAADGAMIGGAQLVPINGGPNSSSDYTFMKGNGLGDLELVCNAAPLQVGNRVWLDENRNGIQDATEPPIAKVTVRLYNAAGTLVGTAVTDEQGRYYFNSNLSEPAAGDGDNIGGGRVVGEAFTIKLDNAADFTGTGPLAGLTLTKVKQTSKSAGAQSQEINSKATTVSGNPQIAGTAHKAGYNDHSFDVGFYGKSSKGLTVTAVTKRVSVKPKGTASLRVRYRNTGQEKSCKITSVVTIAPGFTVASKGKGATLKGRKLTFTNGKKCLAAGKAMTWTFKVKDTTGKRRCAKFPVVTTASDLAKPNKATLVVCVRGIPVTG